MLNSANKKKINPFEMGVYFVFVILVIVISIGSGGTFIGIRNITKKRI